MSKDTHTQGKWTKWKRYDGKYSVWCDNKDAPKRILICEMNGNEGETNANRIVQAVNSFPDLLEACKSALRQFEYLNSIPNGEVSPADIKSAPLHKLKQAIAKVEDN